VREAKKFRYAAFRSASACCSTAEDTSFSQARSVVALAAVSRADNSPSVTYGVAGHAGLFAPAADLARFTAWWVSADDAVVPAALRRAAASCRTEGLGGRRGYGWACPGDAFDILGGRWPPTAVSHTGFTGTSLALDPVSGAWAVLLTNAVHVGRDATAVTALRRAVHAAAGITGSTPP